MCIRDRYITDSNIIIKSYLIRWLRFSNFSHRIKIFVEMNFASNFNRRRFSGADLHHSCGAEIKCFPINGVQASILNILFSRTFPRTTFTSFSWNFPIEIYCTNIRLRCTYGRVMCCGEPDGFIQSENARSYMLDVRYIMTTIILSDLSLSVGADSSSSAVFISSSEQNSDEDLISAKEKNDK